MPFHLPKPQNSITVTRSLWTRIVLRTSGNLKSRRNLKKSKESRRKSDLKSAKAARNSRKISEEITQTARKSFLHHFNSCNNQQIFKGACWAFSATGAMEGINQIKTGSLVSLSEQELIDCDRTYNSGCAGGLMDYAYKWVVQNHGIDSEDDYPFKSADGTCNQIKANHRVVTIDGYTAVPPKNEDQLLQAVAIQPVSVGICGSERSFQLYSKGIFTGPCSTSLDHAVLIVGYGSENGVDYWIIKNSWGSKWGMDGYMYMLRNGGDPQGVCGINLLASYPTKTSPNPPPSPGPTPTKCSLVTYCPAGNTCCCTWHIFGLCLSWSCCELDSAICCKDHRYCCPHDYPVCDIRSKQCFKGNGNVTRVLGIERKSSFVKLGAWNPSLEACYE